MKYSNKSIKNTGLPMMLLFALSFLTGMAERPPLVGGPAPEFQLDQLGGSPIKMSDYRGKVVLLNFWATWCGPCKKEMPEMQAAYDELKDQGFVILALNFGEKAKKAEKLVKEMGLTFPILLDRKVEVAERHRVVSLPVTFFVDPKGIIKEQVFGGSLTKDQIVEIFQKLR
ncbi:Thiol:disulfide oxidoreductase related to ResA [hydrothermal vent metagenome]|uniref:Thiol:disulfide oxidoreductase related to ResA n=1 Tax=hydrothermal vent metagenome TaxID=652676 RepID=A0A3B1CUB4_9ZZZZ